ncbi:MAG: hypothetical protein FWH17_03450 [Oscillospiraceae bacterium]|nr:hypothetical protein [Oscillospiraceae bacterium]
MAGIYRFINTDIPSVGCNLRCEYCYIIQHGDEASVLKIDAAKKLFNYPVEHMQNALTVERMGGVCMFNISGSGETLLNPEIVPLTYGLLKNGHYVALINNCTISNRIAEMTEFPTEFRSRLFFKVSFHYRELKRRGMLYEFAENVTMLKKAGIAFSIEVVSNDYVLNEIEELQKFSKEHFGALPHVLAGRDEQVIGTYPKFNSRLSSEQYNKVWSSFDSDLFKYQQKTYEIPHREFCYAGVFTGTLSLGTGDFAPCPGTKKVTNLFEDINSPIAFAPVGQNCPFEYCYCSFFLHVLAGVSFEYDPGVRFWQFRDRICDDGSRWLTPTIREAFSHRCCEYHTPYSDDRAFFMDQLMRVRYGGLVADPDIIAKTAVVVANALNELNIRKIAIYGMAQIGKWFLSILNETDIEVVCGIDHNFQNISVDIEILSPDDDIPNVDAIIVSVFYEFTNIDRYLREKTNIPIISIVQLEEKL